MLICSFIDAINPPLKINSGPEEDVEEIEEAEECGTRSINNNNINNTFDFIVFAT